MAKGNLIAKYAYTLHIFRLEDRAFAQYEKAYQKGCDLANPMAAYSLMLMRRHEFEKALEVLRKARKFKLSEEQYCIVYQNLGLAYWKLGDVDHALDIYLKLFEKLQTTNIYSTLGFLLIAKADQTGDYEEALAFNRKAYDYDNSDASIADNLGQVLYRTGEMKEAEEMFEKALSIKPTQFDTLVYLAKIRIAQGRKDEAEKLLDTALNKPYAVFNTVPREEAVKVAGEIGMDVSKYEDTKE